MATLDHVGNQNLPGRHKARQTVAATTTTGQSAAFTDHTNCVRIWGDAAFFYEINSNPTATIDGNVSAKLPANTIMYEACAPRDKIAVITSTGSANIYITEF